MEVTQYYITTITNAAMKIGPVVIFIVVGYFIFIKLPFLFLLNNMKKSKQELQKADKDPALETKEPAYSVKDYERFVARKKAMDSLPPGGNEKRQEKQQEKKQESKQEQKQRAEQQKKKEEPKQERPRKDDATAETLFEIKPGQSFTKEELRKKYHELLKMNHPDKVASLSADFKKLADQKTKDINSAYEKLLKRAG